MYQAYQVICCFELWHTARTTNTNAPTTTTTATTTTWAMPWYAVLCVSVCVYVRFQMVQTTLHNTHMHRRIHVLFVISTRTHRMRFIHACTVCAGVLQHTPSVYMWTKKVCYTRIYTRCEHTRNADRLRGASVFCFARRTGKHMTTIPMTITVNLRVRLM